MVKLYIATTLNGYIARPDGAIDWLENLPNPDGTDYGYGRFIADIGTVVMGRKTYEKIQGFGVDWPYADCRCYLLSRQPSLDLPTPRTTLLPEVNATTVQNISSETSPKGIWVVGGGETIAAFLRKKVVSEVTISVVPRLIGQGIPLFPDSIPEIELELLRTESFANGLVNLVYRCC